MNNQIQKIFNKKIQLTDQGAIFYFEHHHPKSKKMILITGAMDGDEPIGTEVVLELQKTFLDKNFPFSFLFVPTVNIFGKQRFTSFNPIDGKFPKYLFPGKEKGTSTEQIIFKLNKECISRSGVWIDLHSGSKNEMVNPFVELFFTGEKNSDVIVKKLLQNLDVERLVIHQKPFFSSREMRIAKQGCVYVRIEIGGGGIVKDEDKLLMSDWIFQILGILENVSQPKRQHQKKVVYHKTFFCLSDRDFFWDEKKILNHQDLLWWRFSGKVKNGEILYCLGKKTIKQQVLDWFGN